MKRICCLVCFVTFLLSGCLAQDCGSTAPEQTAAYTHGIYELTFHAKLLSNDSIGNDWSTTYTHNEKTIQSGYTILSPLGVFTFQTIAVEIRENDKLDDIGSGVLHVGICDGGSGDVQITVVENGGKYNGNTALWEITCSVKLIGKQ